MSDVYGLQTDFIYIGILGLWVGSIVGAMAQVVPYQVVILLTMALGIVVWLPGSPTFNEYLLTAGVGTAGLVGTMAGVIPWGVAVCGFIAMGVMMWKGFGVGYGRLKSVPQLILIPLFVLVFTGLFYNLSFVDFCEQGVAGSLNWCANPNLWAGGQVTGWSGCFSTCQFTTFSVFGSSAFANFFTTGNFLDLMTGLLTAPNGLISLVSVITGLVMLILGSGLGVSIGASFLASGVQGGVQPNTAGSQMAQSLGMGMLIFGIVNGAFGGLFAIFGPSNAFMGGMGVTIDAIFALAVFYGFYQNGRVATV